MGNENYTFMGINQNGEQVECEILFTFESEKTGKNYIVYTDNTLDDDGSTRVYASIYNPNEEKSSLYPVETEEEWKIIQTMLTEIAEKYGGGAHEE